MKKLFLKISVACLLFSSFWAYAVEKSKISLEGSPNTTEVGVLMAEGEVAVAAGGSAVIYGARGRCGREAPAFEEAIRGLDSLPDGVGEFYDAGVGVRVSASCGGTVKARAIGIKLYPDFRGEAVIMFFRSDKITIKVQ